MTLALHSPFLALPPELRQPIYGLLLTLPSPDDVESQPTIPLSRTSSPAFVVETNHAPLKGDPHRASILLTSRLTHSEALPLLYTLNTFTAHPTLLVSMPSHAIAPSRPILTPALTRLIRKWTIHVRLDIDARFSEAQATAAFTGAEDLTIMCTEAMYRSAGCGVVLLFKGVRGVGRCSISGNGVDRGIRTWLEYRMRREEGWEDDGDWRSAVETEDPWALRGQDTTGLPRGGLLYDIWTHGNR